MYTYIHVCASLCTSLCVYIHTQTYLRGSPRGECHRYRRTMTTRRRRQGGGGGGSIDRTHEEVEANRRPAITHESINNTLINNTAHRPVSANKQRHT